MNKEKNSIRFWKAAALLTGTLTLAEAGGTAYFYRRTMIRNNAYMKRTMKMAGTDWNQYMDIIQDRKEKLVANPHQDLYLTSDDGLKLHGTWFPNQDAKKIVICFHGYTSQGMNDFVGLSDYFLRNGFAMLLVDERAHGMSEGEQIGFGCLDRHDAMGWIRKVIEICGEDVEILLHGISMGGATVLMTAGLELPAQVKALVSDCGFTSPKYVFTHVLHTMYHLPAFPMIQIASLVNQKRAGYGLDDCNAAREVGKAKIPVSLIHGDADTFVPCSMCELIDRADVTVLVLDEIRADVAAIVKDRCPKLKTLISMQKTEQDEQAYSFWQLLEKQEAGYSYEPEPDQLCTIMFISGTTGKSKGVMLTHRNLAENATCLDMKIPPRTTILSVLPIHHAYCLSMDILKGISLGSIICINDSLLRVAKNIRLFQPDMIDLFESYGITILQGYGMTECAPVISTNVSWDIRKNSVGKLLPNCEAKVVDKELWVRGSSVMQGYYHMPEETKETLVDGWLRTGDLGYVDEDGFVYLTGRKKNLIITKNGENVSPEELENKIGEARLVQENLVREKEGVIEAEIFPDLDYVKKKRIKNVEEELQKVIDAYNQEAPAYKRVYKLKVREREFEKTPSKKIKRY